jgi:hypothetical protein
MYSNAKANALIRDMADKLSKRLAFSGTSVNTVTQASYTDANGAVWPYLIISENGVVSESNPVIYIEISNVDMVSKDVFGNQTYAYAPHVLQLAYELNSAGAPIPSAADLAACTYEAEQTGVRTQIKQVANGTAVTAASVNAAAPIADLEDIYWPTKKV